MWLGAELVVLVLGAWIAWRGRQAPELQVTTARVSTGPIVRRIIATGILRAVATVEVAARVSGTIQSVEVDAHAIVHTGQVLARLDPTLFNAQLDEAEAVLKHARVIEASLGTAVEDAQRALARAGQLAARQLIAQSDLDAARTAVGEATAEATAGALQAIDAASAVDQARQALAQTIISSPVGGIVVGRNAGVGQTVGATLESPVLFNIATDLTHLEMQIDVDEADAAEVQAGEPATFEVESYRHETFEGRVAAAAGFTTRIEVSNPDERLRPGMTATVVLNGSRREHALRIPNTALAFHPPADVVDALGETGDVPLVTGETHMRQVWEYDGRQLTPIEVHAGLADDEWTEVVDGALQAGEALVTNASLRTGQRR
jgi:HlyD family secretion protein